MPHIELRLQAGARSAGDLIVTVQDKTFEYLMTSPSPEIRVSAFLDRDWPQVEAQYAELYVNDECPFRSRVMQVIPGSRTRGKLSLPCPMKEGEQLTVLVSRAPISFITE